MISCISSCSNSVPKQDLSIGRTMVVKFKLENIIESGVLGQHIGGNDINT